MVCVDGRNASIDLYAVNVRERTIGIGPEPIRIVVANHGIYARGKIIVGFSGDDVDGTANRIPAIERALRAAENLDAIDIVELGIDRRASLQRHTVDAVGHG